MFGWFKKKSKKKKKQVLVVPPRSHLDADQIWQFRRPHDLMWVETSYSAWVDLRREHPDWSFRELLDLRLYRNNH